MVITLGVYKIVVIFGSSEWFSGMANLMVSFKFTPRLSLVAMAMKFVTKWAITQLLLDISARSLRIYGVFWD